MSGYIALPKQAIDLTGQRFGRLVALGPIGQTKGTQIIWECLCDCGKIHAVQSTHLRTGHTSSCGCLANELTSRRTRTHGMSRSKIHYIWVAIIQRCCNPSNKGYENYGGRGISMADEWRDSFASFYSYVSGLEHFGTPKYSVDRIDNDAGYIPGNLRWVPRVVQNRNKRDNRIITIDGRSQCLSVWEAELGFKPGTAKRRIYRGWTEEEALSIPVNERRQ